MHSCSKNDTYSSISIYAQLFQKGHIQYYIYLCTAVPKITHTVVYLFMHSCSKKRHIVIQYYIFMHSCSKKYTYSSISIYAQLFQKRHIQYYIYAQLFKKTTHTVLYLFMHSCSKKDTYSTVSIYAQLFQKGHIQ